MSQPPKDANALVAVYSERITEPSTGDEVYGYWLFVVGLVASVVGVALLLYTATLERPPAAQGGTYWMLREIGVVFAAGGVPVMLAGIAIRLPLRRVATWLTMFGTVVCLGALAWFLTVYPTGWSTASGNPSVIGLYTAGLAVIALSSVFIPMLSRAETETESERAAREQREAAFAATEARLERTEQARDEARTERDEANVAADAAAAELESIRQSKARFELFEDRGGGHRWRLRHRNGNVIADSGEGYASRQKCQQGMHSVMRNALGADVLLIEPDDPAMVVEETETEPIELESRASFELFEDTAGEWRWRLVHDNGNIIADSGEGYASKGNARRAMAGVREHAAAADYLRIDPTGFEVYRDRAGEWRWRLVHDNGNILADSGEGYASRQKARQGLESVRANAGDAEVEER
jgi:uncharacterized protein YegP (UPF0339 family)/predicted phage tail protein